MDVVRRRIRSRAREERKEKRREEEILDELLGRHQNIPEEEAVHDQENSILVPWGVEEGHLISEMMCSSALDSHPLGHTQSPDCERKAVSIPMENPTLVVSETSNIANVPSLSHPDLHEGINVDAAESARRRLFSFSLRSESTEKAGHTHISSRPCEEELATERFPSYDHAKNDASEEKLRSDEMRR